MILLQKAYKESKLSFSPHIFLTQLDLEKQKNLLHNLQPHPCSPLPFQILAVLIAPYTKAATNIASIHLTLIARLRTNKGLQNWP